MSVLLAVSAIAFSSTRDMSERTRGVTYRTPGDPANASPAALGVNVSLEQYSDADLARALDLMRSSGLVLARQHFSWNDIEPRQGDFQWDRWDRIVARATERQIGLVAVLDTTPEWARDPGERDLVHAPPPRVDDYARFVSAFVQRYGDRVHYVQIWDDPNVHPYWGRHNADPGEYTALLHAGATDARAANPGVKVLSAGLSPNTELIRGHPDYSDVLFLRGMYEAGARADFDILAAKPYGMWTGPDDRRVAMDIFDFSRAILLREEMVAHGDAGKPVWAVEFGWNALDAGWAGKPSPWGTDAFGVQGARLKNAVGRARAEWPWMASLIVQTWQPNAPADDPQWGFALVDKSGQPRPLLAAVKEAAAAKVEPASFDFTRFYGLLALLGVVALAAVCGGAFSARRIPWRLGWSALHARYLALPEVVQFGMVVLTTAAFYYSRNAILNFVFLALLVLLFALRLDLGLVVAVFTIPFYLFPKNLIGSMQFSLVEVLTIVAVVARALQWAMQESPGHETPRPSGGSAQVSSRLKVLAEGWRRANLNTCDLAVLFFVLSGIVSILVAANFGVANREFRVIVLEPALLYALVRFSGLERREMQRLIDAFVASALVISFIGLYQFFFTNYVIIGEGVRRILAVYGSPNNLALYLDRALPLLVAMVVYTHDARRRGAYALAALPIALCWYLTYSRASWVGVAAGLVFIGLASGPRIRLAVAGLIVAGAILLIPFLGTERAQSLFQNGTGTGFFRLSVMQSGAEMIRDHPLLGVGLDNFLYEYPRYIKPDAWREPNLSHPHNIILDFWVRMGIPGLLALIWMLVEFYRRGFLALRQMPRADGAIVLGLMAGMTAALAHGMMDAAYFYVDLAFVWMLMLAVIANLPHPPLANSVGAPSPEQTSF